MSKIKVLNQIIENISGFNDELAVNALCEAVLNSEGGCADIKCDDCPFNSDKDFTQLAVDLDGE